MKLLTANIEQVSVVIRFVDSEKCIREKFLGFVTVERIISCNSLTFKLAIYGYRVLLFCKPLLNSFNSDVFDHMPQ